MEEFVADASPVILLHKAGLEGLLVRLPHKLVLPQGVVEEIAAHADDGIAERIHADNDIDIVLVPPKPIVQAWDLGKGETEVIAYAYRRGTSVAIVDDAAARACCRALGIRAMGTGALLIRGKQAGLLPSVRDALTMLRQHGMWISDTVAQLLCERAGETW